LKRLAVLVFTSLAILGINACGGSSNNSNPNGQKSNLTHRVFITNSYSGNVLIVDSQTDKAAYTQQQTTNASGQTVTISVPTAINVGGQLTWGVNAPNSAQTAVYASNTNTVTFLTNASETVNTSVVLAGSSNMGVFSPDSTILYAPVRNAPVSGARNGEIQAITVASSSVTANYPVPSVISVAVSTSGQYLLAFSDDSDTATLINTKASPVTYTAISGLARPVNAFFTSDSTAYVLNCGPECASTAGPPSVSQVDIPSASVKATVPVGGATVGLLKGNNLYVAGNPGPAGTVDIVDISAMTRTTATSIPISDGLHTQMQISTNNKLYVGAQTCSNITTGCLSVVNLNTNTADPPLPPNGPITGMLAIANRNTMYVIQKGYLAIYDTTTDTLQSTQIVFTGALSDVVLVDPQ
jgi:hypothetical protein